MTSPDPNPYPNFDRRKHVRQRPGMYIGGIAEFAVRRMIENMINFLIIEYTVGRMTTIRITLHADKSIVVEHDGIGLSVAMWDKQPITYLEAMLEHEGVLQHIAEPDVYPFQRFRYMSQLTELCIINPLSATLKVENWRDGVRWEKSYAEGLPTTPLTHTPDATHGIGTRFTFTPDPTIFKDEPIDFLTLIASLQQITALLPGLTIMITDRRHDKTLHMRRFHYPDGLSGYLIDRLPGRMLFHRVHLDETFTLPPDPYPHSIRVQIALHFVASGARFEYSAVNQEETDEGGTHLAGVIAGLTKYMNRYVRRHYPDEAAMSPNDLHRVIAMAVGVNMPFASFGGSMKRRLITQEIFDLAANMVYAALVQAEDSHDQRNALCDFAIAQRTRMRQG